MIILTIAVVTLCACNTPADKSTTGTIHVRRMSNSSFNRIALSLPLINVRRFNSACCWRRATG
jgi:hypothetical protein